jgi:hypothetical protein
MRIATRIRMLLEYQRLPPESVRRMAAWGSPVVRCLLRDALFHHLLDKLFRRRVRRSVRRPDKPAG